MGGFARCRGMHTVSIYCDRRWFCRPPVMRPPWRRYSKKDPALVPAAASSPSSSVSRFVDLRARKRNAVFCATAYVDSTPGFWPGLSLSLSPNCLHLLVVSRNRNASAVLEIRPALTASNIPDNARSIKRIWHKLLAWVDAKGTSRGTRYANAEFLKILRNILLAGNFPAGILCPQKLPPPNFRKV